MTTITPPRVEQHMLPVDTDGTDARFEAFGFGLGDTDPTNPLYRTVYLPGGWYRQGNRILDRLSRERVHVFEWTGFGTTFAHMHLTDLRVYLRMCIASGEKPLLDPKWATQKAVLGAARSEIERCEDRIDDYTRRGPVRDIETERAKQAAFIALAESLTLDMTAVA